MSPLIKSLRPNSFAQLVLQELIRVFEIKEALIPAPALPPQDD